MRALLIACLLLGSQGCALDASETWDFGLPERFPVPVVPPDNPMSEEKVELGRRLFYEPALSGNQTQSCASCHQQSRAFTDGLARSIGSTGDVHPRNAMSLTNVAYMPALTWANPLLDSLEKQALVPMFGDHPVELGLAGRDQELLRRLALDPGYSARFAEAFPEDTDPISIRNIVRALAAFQRTLISHRSPYDRYVYENDPSALSDSAKRGAALFFSEKLECFHCHGGPSFTDSSTHDGRLDGVVTFHNNGLYNIDGRGAYPPENRGLYDITGDPRDMGRFRSPTLRNIALTAPYFHDGSAATLEEVIAHYEAGGRTIEDGPSAGVGAESPLRSIFVRGFSLSEEERADLLAFLHSLTDSELVSDPRFSDPFAP